MSTIDWFFTSDFTWRRLRYAGVRAAQTEAPRVTTDAGAVVPTTARNDLQLRFGLQILQGLGRLI